LDVGCGKWHLLQDYLSEVVDIDDVDNSPEMHDLCRQKAAGAECCECYNNQAFFIKQGEEF